MLIKRGKARVYRFQPFTILLTEREGGAIQPVEHKIDPGSRTTGMALVATFQKKAERSFLVLTLSTEGNKSRKLSTKDELSDDLDVLDTAATEKRVLVIGAGYLVGCHHPFDRVSKT